MITQKIAEAKRAKRQLFFKTLLIIIVLTVLCVALMLWASAPNPPIEIADDESQRPSVKVDNTPVEQQKDSEVIRQAYLEMFVHFENKLRPELDKIDVQKWDKSLAERLLTTEKSAIKQFGEGKYVAAKATLNELVSLAGATITDSKNQYATAMQEAQQAFDNNHYQHAKLAIGKAKMLDTISQSASALAERVEQLPEITSLVEQIRVARAENNPQTELERITELLTLTPERTKLKQRAEALQTTLNAQRFQSLIAQSYASIEYGRIEAAKATLSQARKIYSNRSELNDVSSTINKYEQNYLINAFHAKARLAESKDDWQAVKNNLEQVVKETPDNKAATDKLVNANKIVSLNKQIDEYLKAPYRLANEQQSTQAETIIRDAKTYRNQSISLARQSHQLEVILAAVNSVIPVEVRSDNQTHILVRGIGNVGVVNSKIIQLKPGQYTFEGKRKGFKSKIVEVTIPYDSSRYSLRVVCDEPI